MDNIITPEFRVSWPKLFEKKAYGKNKEKYSIVMLFDKKTDISELVKMYELAANETFPDKRPETALEEKIFRDGDIEHPDIEGYRNVIFVSASQWGDPPSVIDGNGHVLGRLDLYPGCYAKASIHVYASKEHRRVTFIVNGVQKTRDGEPFGKSDNFDVHDAFGTKKPDAQAAFNAIR